MITKTLLLVGTLVPGLAGCALDRHGGHHGGGHGMMRTPLECRGSACNIDVTVVTKDGKCIASIANDLHVFAATNIHWNLRTPGYSFPSSPSSAIFFKDPTKGQFTYVSGGATQVIIRDAHSDAVSSGTRVTYRYGVRVHDDNAKAMCLELDPPIINEYP